MRGRGYNGSNTNSDAKELFAQVEDLHRQLQDALHRFSHLEKSIENFPDCAPQENDDMAYKINRAVTIHGQKHWIRADTEQEYADKISKLLLDGKKEQGRHNYEKYAWRWFEIFAKPNIETATATTYKRQLTLHILPRIGAKNIEEITVADVQEIFNSISGTKATKDKVKMVLNMIFEAAIEDKIIEKNPLKSKQLKIKGKASKATEPYSVEQMQYLASKLDKIESEQDRNYMILQMFHPLRLEEVLGLKWCDIDYENNLIHIARAVTHPTRNQPEIKETKTDASIRSVGLCSLFPRAATKGNPDDFIIGGKKPCSYTQVRRMCERIKRSTEFSESITPIRFRTTTLTDLYEKTKDIKQVQAAAGHTTATMTLEHYVKGRSTLASTAAIIEQAYIA